MLHDIIIFILGEIHRHMSLDDLIVFTFKIITDNTLEDMPHRNIFRVGDMGSKTVLNLLLQIVYSDKENL